MPITRVNVILPTPHFLQPTYSNHEIKELEQELECPICMDISRPPIYQCEEGHIICSTCKPLLTNCPHCSKPYSNPVIRCRFAEKLSERYFRMVKENEEASNGGGQQMTVDDLLQWFLVVHLKPTQQLLEIWQLRNNSNLSKFNLFKVVCLNPNTNSFKNRKFTKKYIMHNFW